jgi:hypothetical protein
VPSSVLHDPISQPQTSGRVERVQGHHPRGALEVGVLARYQVPEYMGPRLDLARYLRRLDTEGAHTGRWTKGGTPRTA